MHSAKSEPSRRDETKICASCGREMRWRPAWAAHWDEVKYCSAACRSRKVTAQDRQLEETILSLLDQRAATATICPSDAARAIGGEEWRELMEPARRAARRLVADGAVDITQGGRIVDPSTAKGPIRIPRLNGTRPGSASRLCGGPDVGCAR